MFEKLWSNFGAAPISALLAGGGVWGWLKLRTRLRVRTVQAAIELDRAGVKREGVLYKHLLERIDFLETEIRGVQREMRIVRKAKHELAAVSNATRMALALKIMEINQVLIDHGKPAKYDVSRETMRIINEVGQSIIGENERALERAARAVDLEDQTTRADNSPGPIEP